MFTIDPLNIVATTEAPVPLPPEKLIIGALV